MREYLEELRENWDDAYWRADHPEVVAVLVAIITGAIGLLFAWIEISLHRIRLPEAKDV
jgi:hypothetical protein